MMRLKHGLGIAKVKTRSLLASCKETRKPTCDDALCVVVSFGHVTWGRMLKRPSLLLLLGDLDIPGRVFSTDREEDNYFNNLPKAVI